VTKYELLLDSDAPDRRRKEEKSELKLFGCLSLEALIDTVLAVRPHWGKLRKYLLSKEKMSGKCA